MALEIVARVVLAPDRRRLAASLVRGFTIAAQSDQKLYARGKTFLPIFPTDDTALQAAITLVVNQLKEVVDA